jgi:nucleoside-diphosphate-sugar epimerase
MRKVLIIGCGYLGSHLANYYCQQGWQVKIVGKKSMHKDYLNSKVEFYEIDIRDSVQLQSVIEQDDIVIYAAGSINATNSFVDITRDINEFYLSFVNLINLCAEKKISKFVFLSSAGTVYGDTNSPSHECDSLNPMNIYGLQKVFFENLIKIKQNETNQFPYLILRISNPYGGIQNPQKNQGIIPVLINRALSKEEFVFWGNVNSTRDFIYIEDFLNATYLCTEKITDEIINIASGISVSIKEVIEVVQKEVGYDIQMIYKSANNKIVLNNHLDNNKLIQLAGFTPTTTLKEGVSLMVKNILSST